MSTVKHTFGFHSLNPPKCINVHTHSVRLLNFPTFSSTLDIISYLKYCRTSLVTQWLRICLPVQGTRVRALVQEDPTCRRATKPVYHNYWAYALEPECCNYWAHVPQLLKPAHLEPMLCNKRSHRNEKPTHHEAHAPQRRVAPTHRN